MRALLFSLALCLAAALPSWAGSVDCSERSLGALCRDAEAIALVEVRPAGHHQVRLKPVQTLAGQVEGQLQVSLDLEGSPSSDARGLAFLRRDEGTWTCLELILFAKAEDARALSAAVRARLAPKPARVAALFAELNAPQVGLRRDAARDLIPALRVGLHSRKLTPDERAQVLAALETGPTLELLVLCRELACPELAPALLPLAAAAPHPSLQVAAAQALATCDRAAALEVWGRELAANKAGVERLLGYLGGREAGRLLSAALASERAQPRRLALLCALADCQSARASVLAQVARQPLHPGEVELALAVLARCSEGRVLRDLGPELASEYQQQLAHALRRDPLELALRIQRQAEEELLELNAEK